ncbi:hypothetical protein BH23VER1_BH23VER1_18960 [soil metagenome]
MKRVWHHPQEPETTGKRYWRSLGELEDTPEFRGWLEREFPQGASEMAGEGEASASRRTFLKLMGAATSLAGFGMASCRRPHAFLVPFAEGVEWSIPGRALYYATAMPRPGGCTPMIATTFDGRPTHLEGNRLHPRSGSGLDGFAQASVLDLYDPDRSRFFLKGGKQVGVREFHAEMEMIRTKMVDAGGKGAGFLVGESTSPTRARLVAALQDRFPALRFFRYEAINLDNVRAANTAVFGEGVLQSPNLDKARRVLSLDCDFLGLDRLATNPAGDFMKLRRVDGTDASGMSRLYTLEPNYTVTGGMADHRLPLNASQIPAAAAALAGAPGVGGATVAGGTGRAGTSDDGLAAPILEWIAAAAKDLQEHSGESIVLAGPAQPAVVHQMVAAINGALGSFGETIDLLQGDAPEAEFGTLADLVDAMKDGSVETLFVTTEADPAFDAPVDIGFAEVQKNLGQSIHLGTRSRTATARNSAWHIPGAHYLETWGDARSADGTYSVIQPMILPLFDGLSELDLMLLLLAEAEPDTEAGAESAGADAPVVVAAPPPMVEENVPMPAMLAVRETFDGLVTDGDPDEAWNFTLRDGFLAGSAFAPASAASAASAAPATDLPALERLPAPSKDAIEIVFKPDSKIYDGRYINNGWQQEAPDPITKLTWDNAALMSIRTAREFGITDSGKMVKIEVGEASALMPVLIAPGHADNAVTISMGYGQPGTNGSGPGRVGEGTGFNALPLRNSAASYIVPGARVSRVKGDSEIDGRTVPANYPLALTQEHNSMYGRALVREGTVERFNSSPTFAKSEGMDSHIPENISFYKTLDRDGNKLINDPFHQWGMTIDLNQCLGCNACLLACQSENNIPIVGKNEVILGREMHWIRMDRYFATADPKADKAIQGTDKKMAYSESDQWDNPEMVVQPVACQHCELAPCETVCPVNATVHDEQGLNAMAYNRCIGTRYCAANCPYKVRRFNFFDYNKRPLDELARGPFSTSDKTGVHQSLELQKNPNVTVRMRGVMEKCTFCVQRIQNAKINQLQIARDSSNKRVPTNAVRTACQAACPAEAISFGNLLNEDDEVTKLRVSPRGYDLLAYVGTRPRTRYLARLKNPNPELDTARGIGEISEHIH